MDVELVRKIVQAMSDEDQLTWIELLIVNWVERRAAAK